MTQPVQGRRCGWHSVLSPRHPDDYRPQRDKAAGGMCVPSFFLPPPPHTFPLSGSKHPPLLSPQLNSAASSGGPSAGLAQMGGCRVCPEWVWLGTEASTTIQQGRKAGRREVKRSRRTRQGQESSGCSRINIRSADRRQREMGVHGADGEIGRA